MTAFNFSAQFIGLADFGLEIGKFIGNFIGAIIPWILVLAIIGGVTLLIRAVINLIKDALKGSQ